MERKRMRNLAICIPTYNRSEVIKDTFAYELDTCRRLGIDIYLYDSSSDGKTKEYIETLTEYDNLHYISIDPATMLDDKVVMIYQLYGRNEKHDYLWLVGDGIGFGEELLKKVLSAIQTDPTLIFINNEDLQKLGNKEYHDVSSIYQELFWKSTLWGSMIVAESLYYEIDWKPYIDKFVGTDQISLGIHWYRLAQVKDFRALLFSVRKNIDMRKSSVKKLAWWKEKECGSETVYRVWAKGLVDVTRQLPFSAGESNTALKTWHFYMKTFHLINLCRSRKDRVYNLDIFRKYGKEIKIITGYPEAILSLIARMPIFLMKVFVRIVDVFYK